jgi:hypothetical protein
MKCRLTLLAVAAVLAMAPAQRAHAGFVTLELDTDLTPSCGDCGTLSQTGYSRPLRASSVPGPESAKVDEAGKALADKENFGRRDWDRTSDHFHVKEVLYH